MVKKSIVLGVDWPWSSMSNLTCKSKFIPFWACPYNNLSPVQATITKFGPEMHLNTVKIPVDFGRDKPSASISFLIVKAIFLTYLRCFCINISIGNRYYNRFINLRRPIVSLNHSGASAPTVFTNPDNIRDRACAVLHSRWAGHPICGPSWIIAVWFSYCSVNPLCPQNFIYHQSDLSCL